MKCRGRVEEGSLLITTESITARLAKIKTTNRETEE